MTAKRPTAVEVFEEARRQVRDWASDKCLGEYGYFDHTTYTDFEDKLKALLEATVEAVDVGFDDYLEGHPGPAPASTSDCKKCTWDSGPYSLPCEAHSKRSDMDRRITGDRPT